MELSRRAWKKAQWIDSLTSWLSTLATPGGTWGERLKSTLTMKSALQTST